MSSQVDIRVDIAEKAPSKAKLLHFPSVWRASAEFAHSVSKIPQGFTASALHLVCYYPGNLPSNAFRAVYAHMHYLHTSYSEQETFTSVILTNCPLHTK